MKPERWSKVESIFHKALEADENRRSSVIEESCAGDEELRREVESLLAHYGDAVSFIEKPAFADQANTTTAPPATTAAPRPDLKGVAVGHYRIVEEIGFGGMGVVYKAEDTRLGRLVALKFLPEHMAADSVALERFRREARSASSLNHPNICTIYDIDVYEGREFIVMEYLDGQTLAMYMAGRRAVDTQLVAKLGMPIAEALSAAHSKGVIHRDIKPGNIFVTQSGLVKVLDFGVAKLVAEANQFDATTLTETNTITGTLPYMSPEQLRGENVDTRSDIYALGVVLYEIATGQRLYSSSLHALLVDEILNRPASPPSSINKKLSAKADDIILKCLAKDPEDRYQTAKEIAVDLRHLSTQSTSGSVSADTSSVRTGSRFWPRRPSEFSRKQAAIVAACMVVLAAAGYAAWRLWPRPRPFAAISVSQITNVGTIEKIALSGDGRFLAEVKQDKGQRTLWVRNTATNTDTQILSAFGNDYVGLTFSPDGNYLYFVRPTLENSITSALYVMPVFGGTPRQLISNIDSIISFSPDGSRFTYGQFTPERKDQASEIRIANKDGSDNQVVYATREESGAPAWSPKGDRIAWIGTVGPAKYALQIFEIASRKLTKVATPPDISLADLSDVVWTPDGRHLLAFYVRPHSDHTQIGMVTLPSGDFHPVTNDVSSYSELALSADGRTLATVLTNIDSSIAWYKPDGGAPISTTPLRIAPENIAWANEDRLLFSVSGVDIGWIDRTAGEVHTFDLGETTPGDYITTCPDGHILFTGFAKGASELRIFRMDADGGNIIQLATGGIAPRPGCSSDSREVFYFVDENEMSEASLWSVPLSGGKARQILPSEAIQPYGISSDGGLAIWSLVDPPNARWKIFDLASGRQVSEIPLDASDVGNLDASSVRFSPDNHAAVYAVLRDASRTLLYQPLDGSAPHTLLDPVQEIIPDFGWSPSGKQLAVVKLKSSSDVVLIKDQQEKGKD